MSCSFVVGRGPWQGPFLRFWPPVVLQGCNYEILLWAVIDAGATCSGGYCTEVAVARDEVAAIARKAVTPWSLTT